MSVAELQKTIRGLSAEDRKALATIAVRMKERYAVTRRRKPAKSRKLDRTEPRPTETGAQPKPSLIRSSDDPALDAELRRRLKDRSPGAWLSLEEFRAQTKPRRATR
jgi:hypothetical protein